MFFKPSSTQVGDLFKFSRLAEKVRRTRHNAQIGLTNHLRTGVFVQTQYKFVQTSDNQQRRAADLLKQTARQIRSTTARDNRRN